MKPHFLGLPLIMLMAAPLGAQTVQLPTFHSFSVSTTVVVPDGGTASLGGVTHARSWYQQFGGPLRRQRAMGKQLHAVRSGISAQIHDFNVREAELQQQAAAKTAQPAHGAIPQPRILAGNRPSDQPVASVAEIQRRRAAATASQADEAEVYFQRARQAEAAGRASVARIYYQMAARRATPELKQRIAAHQKALARSQ